MHTRDTISKELKRIQDSVPEIYRVGLITEKDKTPTMKFVADKLLESDTVAQETKDAVQSLKDNGYFNKKKLYEDPKIAKQRDLWVQREIQKSVKAGRLPTKKQLKELKLAELNEKE